MDIKVGNIVFHKIRKDFGPGTVLAFVHDPSLDIVMTKVMWQSTGQTLEHLQRSLVRLGESL